jgi:hypothetical protein
MTEEFMCFNHKILLFVKKLEADVSIRFALYFGTIGGFIELLPFLNCFKHIALQTSSMKVLSKSTQL